MTDIHPQLRRDCFIIGRFRLCHLLLMNDANYPWFILVPDRDDIREIHQLDASDQQTLIRESSTLARIIEETFSADKINIGALGNIVPQLHLHHIVRRTNDPAWPAPVWGAVPARPYSSAAKQDVIDKITGALGDTNGYTAASA